MKAYLGILCDDCRVYFRIYKHASGKFYLGRCPKCGRYAKAFIDRKRGEKRRFYRYR